MFLRKSDIVLLVLTTIACLGFFSTAQADPIPHEISFQGVLRNDDGTLINDGGHKLKFELATAEDATSFIWWETKTVPTVNGVFNTRLGDVTPFTFDFDTDLWLQVSSVVGVTYVPMGPRIQLTPSPSALFALKVPANSITSSELAPGAAVESLNGLTGAVNLVGGYNVTISPYGNGLLIDAAAGAGGDDGDWTIDGINLTHGGSGVVALGTTTPTRSILGHALLQVQASLYPGLALDATTPSFGRWLMYQNGSSGDLLFSRALSTGLGSAKMILDDDGELGIGLTPQAPLDILGGNYALSSTNGDLQIGSAGNVLQFAVDVAGPGAGRSVIQAQSTAEPPVLNLGVDGYDVLKIQAEYLDFSVFGSKKASFWGGDGDDLGGQLLMYGLGSTSTVKLDGHNGSGGSITVRTAGNVASAGISASSTGGVVTCRNAAGATTLTLDGQYTDGFSRVITDVLEITGGSDLSEQFRISLPGQMNELQPGLVVSIDPQNSGQLQVCQTAYDRKVAGVISGAGGVRPGMLMGQAGSLADGDHPVALTGRVYVQADATSGAIEPGDLLTTSSRPGHAMKVSDHSRANGAILGKAMTSLAAGQGLVLVLVSLQ